MADVAKAQTARLGRRIRERRDELGLTQRQLAERMTASPSVDSQQVSDWERGVHHPTPDNLEILAEALETEVADLVAGPLSERKPKTETPDLMGTVNGDVPDDLRAQLDRIEENQRLILDYFGIESDQHGSPQTKFADAFRTTPAQPAKPARTATAKTN